MECKRCVKCGLIGTLSGVDPKKAVYCKQCFISSVKHKFASAIGKRRIFKDGNRREAIVVYEGNQQSAFLLYLVAQGLSTRNKRLAIEPMVVVLVTKTDEESIQKVTSTIREFQGILKCRWLFVHAASVLGPLNLDDVNGIAGLNLIEEYTRLLSSCSNASVRLELISLLRNILLIRIARFFDIDKVLLPDCADVLAEKALSSFCFARAASVAYITAAVDDRFGDVKIVRPLRDICLKEIAILNRFEASDSYLVFAEPMFSNANLEKSVQSVTADFLHTHLREGFKGVLNTVLSTSSKLKLPFDGKNQCSLCFSLFQPCHAERFCHGCSLIIAEIGERAMMENVLMLKLVTDGLVST